MKNIIRTMPVAVGAILVAFIFAVNANAQCGAADGHNKSIAAGSMTANSILLRVSESSSIRTAPSRDDQTDDVSIVGFWHVKFVSQGTTFIPDGAVVDVGFAQWHKDGTEILNSSRPPATSNFCLGVWEKTGRFTYKLNHFALSSDLSGNLIGPANIREDVTLDASGNGYTGTFSIDQFDLFGNNLAHITGVITATRITVDTKPSDIL